MLKILFFCYTCEGNKLNSDDARFVYLLKPWFARGGVYIEGSEAGMTTSGFYGGQVALVISFRVVERTIFENKFKIRKTKKIEIYFHSNKLKY